MIDGMLTRQTLTAIGHFCFRNHLKECKDEALPEPLLKALLNRIAQEG